MNRNLSPQIAKGMFGGPRGIVGGDYSRSNLAMTSGAVKPPVSNVSANIKIQGRS